MTGPAFRALLIGADFYFPNQLPGGGTFRSLGGCAHDVHRVEAMLNTRIVAPAPVLKKLVASNPKDGSGAPPEPPGERPTYANIQAALDELLASAEAGDQVLIYYSGHGGRVPTGFEDLKGPNGFDETLVPIDIGDATTRYVRDIDLGHYLVALGAKGALTTVVLDSCHSGGATRGPAVTERQATWPAGVRPGDRVDRTPRPRDGVASDDRLREAWNRLRGSATQRSAAPVKSWLPDADGYVLLAACADDESALEVDLGNGVRGGVMTDALLDALRRAGAGQTWKGVRDLVHARVHTQYPRQSPQVLGAVHREVFGSRLSPTRYTMTVQSVDAGARQVTVDAGLASGLVAGAKIGVFRRGTTDFSLPGTRVATGQIRTAKAAEASAEIEDGADVAGIEQGAPAVLLDVPLRHRVHLRREDLPPQIDQETALRAVSAAIESGGRGFLEESGGDVPADFQVALDAQGRYEIRDGAGAPLPYVKPVPSGDAGAAASVVDRLVRLGRFRAVQGLVSPPSSTVSKLRVEVRIAPPEGSPAGVETPPLQPVNGTHEVTHETKLHFRFINENPVAVKVAMLDLQCDWGISMLVPEESLGTPYLVIPPKERKDAVIEMWLPEGFESTLDVFKVFVTVGDADFRWLALPEINSPMAAKGAKRSAPRSPLERLFDALADEQTATRHGRTVAAPGADWAIESLQVHVRPKGA